MSRVDPFYLTKTWRHVRRVKLLADPICEYCHVAEATEVDHVQALSRGGHATAMYNLKSTCHACHSTKTNFIEKQGRDHVPVRGCNPETGVPLDGSHWWNQGKGQKQ